MQYEKAEQLQKEWGDKPCDHPFIEKEYYLGTSTGDRVCSTCGLSASPEYFKQLKEKDSQ